MSVPIADHTSIIRTLVLVGRSHRTEHRCKHGTIVSTFHAQCAMNWGLKSWPYGKAVGICPFQWYMGDCAKYVPNKKYRY